MTSVLVSPADRELTVHLERLGARVITWPQLKITEAEDPSALRQAVADLFGYDWLVLKNDRAAEYFLRSFRSFNSADALDQMRVLAIGETVAERLTEAQIHVDVALARPALRSVFPAIEAYLGGREAISGLNFLFPSAGALRESFESQLEEAGARVDEIIAYRTTFEKQKLSQTRALLVGGGISCAVFTCASRIDELAQLLDTDDLAQLLFETKVFCTDSETRDAAAEFALTEAIIPDQPSIRALANLIANADACA